MLEIPEEEMVLGQAVDGALRGIVGALQSLQSVALLAQCRSALTDGLRSLGLPSTSLVSVAATPGDLSHLDISSIYVVSTHCVISCICMFVRKAMRGSVRLSLAGGAADTHSTARGGDGGLGTRA